MATGVLPMLVGRYTRLAQFFGQAEKEYIGQIRFGFATETYDAEGVPASEPRPLTNTLDELRQLATGFHGEIDQIPPVYSAKKIGGIPRTSSPALALTSPSSPRASPSTTSACYRSKAIPPASR